MLDYGCEMFGLPEQDPTRQQSASARATPASLVIRKGFEVARSIRRTRPFLSCHTLPIALSDPPPRFHERKKTSVAMVASERASLMNHRHPRGHPRSLDFSAPEMCGQPPTQRDRFPASRRCSSGAASGERIPSGGISRTGYDPHRIVILTPLIPQPDLFRSLNHSAIRHFSGAGAKAVPIIQCRRNNSLAKPLPPHVPKETPTPIATQAIASGGTTPFPPPAVGVYR